MAGVNIWARVSSLCSGKVVIFILVRDVGILDPISYTLDKTLMLCRTPCTHTFSHSVTCKPGHLLVCFGDGRDHESLWEAHAGMRRTCEIPHNELRIEFVKLL